jgi:kynurenine formamidase
MERILDLSFKPYACPEGYAAAAVTPKIGWQDMETPILTEPVSTSRDLSVILSFNKRRLAMAGVQPGEIFNYGDITTKPYGTYLTFDNRKSSGRYAMRYASDLPPDKFVGALVLLDLSSAIGPGDEIDLSHLAPHEGQISSGSVLFLRTDYSKNHRPADPSIAYYNNSPTLSKSAAEWLVEKGVKTVGADVRTLDPTYAGKQVDYNIREIFNTAGVLVVEDLANLDQVTENHNYTIVGLPLCIRGVTGGPARVFVINRQKPTEFVDCTHPLEYYPDKITDEFPFVPPKTERPLDQLGDYPNPLPGRINPRELGYMALRQTRLIPFNIHDPERGFIGQEMIIQYGHSTTTHIEAAYFDPWGRHMIPEEIFRRYVRIPADRLIGEGVLLDLSDTIGPGMQIELEHVKAVDPGVKEGDIVFTKTDISDWYYYGKNAISLTPGFSAAATKWLVKKKIRALVIDCPSNERSEPYAALGARYTSNKYHYLLHRNDIPVIDWGTKFRNFQKKRFLAAIMALPVSHQGGYPAHLIAIEDWD